MNTRNKKLHEKCIQGGLKITLYIHTFRNKKIHSEKKIKIIIK